MVTPVVPILNQVNPLPHLTVFGSVLTLSSH